MQTLTSVVDTLYGTIIRTSVQFVMAYMYPESDVYRSPSLLTNQQFSSKPLSHTAQGFVVDKIPVTRGMVMYANASSVPVYKNPTIEFDSKIADIPFGAMVIVGEPKGRFYPVNWQDNSGWALKDDIADSGSETHPKFTVDEANEVDSRNTALVRALIDDVFGLSRSDFSLQAGEYILYKLWRKSITIPWTSEKPRTPGRWHLLLKGQQGIHIGIVPVKGSVMECILDGEIGHVAYVEAVYPDQSISISEVNNPDSGVYKERLLSKEEWIELRPVFIEFE